MAQVHGIQLVILVDTNNFSLVPGSLSQSHQIAADDLVQKYGLVSGSLTHTHEITAVSATHGAAVAIVSDIYHTHQINFVTMAQIHFLQV